ncbi:MAG: hypothetical protein LBJ00_04040 [Planctomycetaceae bacterium]|nr:hypothetical protein [Planctomycetaceae bacterium]
MKRLFWGEAYRPYRLRYNFCSINLKYKCRIQINLIVMMLLVSRLRNWVRGLCCNRSLQPIP